VTRAILLGDKASLEGVTLRFLEGDRGELLAAILSTMTSVAERVGVDGADILGQRIIRAQKEFRRRCLQGF